MPNFWTDPIGFIVQWLTGLMTGWGFSPDLIKFVLALLGSVALPLGGRGSRRSAMRAALPVRPRR